jgi:hypothetical protein
LYSFGPFGNAFFWAMDELIGVWRCWIPITICGRNFSDNRYDPNNVSTFDKMSTYSSLNKFDAPLDPIAPSLTFLMFLFRLRIDKNRI